MSLAARGGQARRPEALKGAARLAAAFECEREESFFVCREKAGRPQQRPAKGKEARRGGVQGGVQKKGGAQKKSTSALARRAPRSRPAAPTPKAPGGGESQDKKEESVWVGGCVRGLPPPPPPCRGTAGRAGGVPPAVLLCVEVGVAADKRAIEKMAPFLFGGWGACESEARVGWRSARQACLLKILLLFWSARGGGKRQTQRIAAKDPANKGGRRDWVSCPNAFFQLGELKSLKGARARRRPPCRRERGDEKGRFE